MDPTLLRARAEAWLREDPDPRTREELSKLLADPKREGELEEQFAASLEFGTAGLRGLLGAGPNRMNRSVVRRTTAGLARYLIQTIPAARTRGVVVGRDGRRMSREFLEDVAQVLAAEGLPAVVFSEPVPTPLVAFAAVQTHAAAAVVITASHNPAEYNGYKVYWENGAQIIPPHDLAIAAAIDQVGPANQVRLLDEAEARRQNLWREVPPELSRNYLDKILALRVFRGRPNALRIVYTAMHGVGGAWAQAALQEAGFDVRVVAEQQEPDAQFPTVRFPNPEEKGALDLAQGLAQRVDAHLVLANDPDADRLGVMARDAQGALRPLSGNEVGVMLGHFLLTRLSPKPDKPLVITTIVSSQQLGHIARELGALYEETLTGFKWVANRAMARAQQDGAVFVLGYEEALGYSVGDVVRDKDGIGTAVVFADLAAYCESQGQTVWGYLEQVQRRFGLFVSEQKNSVFPGAAGVAVIRGIMDHFRRSPPKEIGARVVSNLHDYSKGTETLPPSNVLAFTLDDGSRIVLRPSGTEPKIKYYFEVKEDIRGDEPIGAARGRATDRLHGLENDFLELAKRASGC